MNGTTVGNHEPLAYTIAEAVMVSRIGRTKLFEMIAAGDLKASKVGRRTLITRAELERVLAEAQAGAA